MVEFTTNITLDDVLRILTPQEALQLMMYNLHSYEGYVKEAREGGADIIVFPEDGIYGFVFLIREQLLPFLEEIPDPRVKTYTPCGDASFSDRPVLTYLSCLAQKNEIVLVANMGDKQKCNNLSIQLPSDRSGSECPPNGWYQYNTNVVFDSDGVLLAKYHKTHLYGRENIIFDTPHPTPHVTFHTKFGVTFGTFTCYDILYCDPPLELLNMGIRNFVFPTAWGNSYPFYTSIAFQQAWSWKTRSNFLAANQHFPNKHSFPADIGFYLTGSGVYSNGYALCTYISGENFSPATGKVLITRIKKQPSTSPIFPHVHMPSPNTAVDVTRREYYRSIANSRDRRLTRKEDNEDKWSLNHMTRRPDNLDLITNRQMQKTTDKQDRRSQDTSMHVDLDIDMKSNTYLNFTALSNQLSDIVTVSYTNSSLHLECTLNYSRKQYIEDETYALGAYVGGNRDNPEFFFGVCSLLKCASSDLDTCGEPVKGYSAETMFERIELSGSFPGSSVVFPVVQLNELELVSPSDVMLGESGLVMEGVGEPLLSANLWGRVQLSNEYHCQNTY